jgi:Gpi18-like mannosyltransferase
MDIVITLSVTGKEKVDFTLKYENTDMKTVIAVEQALISAVSGLLAEQK